MGDPREILKIKLSQIKQPFAAPEGCRCTHRIPLPTALMTAVLISLHVTQNETLTAKDFGNLSQVRPKPVIYTP